MSLQLFRNPKLLTPDHFRHRGVEDEPGKLASKAPQNLDAKRKEMIAVEVERTGGMNDAPAEESAADGHFSGTRVMRQVQAA